jgi:uncharacterized RDD family membrane protein YckC
MAEIHLNKPLYKENEAEGTSHHPLRKKGRPALFARVGAILIDLLILHGVTYAFAKFAEPTAIRLGSLGAYIGWLLGFIYLTVGGSSLTDGRTLGKALLRLSVCDISGEPLSLVRSAKRIFYLISPLLLYVILNQVGEFTDDPSQLSVLSSVSLLGASLATAWYVGNTFYCALEPNGRTWYDRMTESVVYATDSTADEIQDFLRAARHPVEPERLRRPFFVLMLCIVVLCGFVGVRVFSQYNSIQKLSDEERQQVIADRQSISLAGFSGPMRIPTAAGDSQATTTAADSQSSAVTYQYIRRGPIDIEKLKQNRNAMTIADRVVELNRRELTRALQRGDYKPSEVPSKLRFIVSFAEFSDLLFSWHARDVLAVSAETNLSDLVSSSTDTTAAP